MSILIDVVLAAVGLVVMFIADDDTQKTIGAIVFMVATAMFAAHWKV